MTRCTSPCPAPRLHLVKSLDIASIEKTIDELLGHVVIHFT